MSRLVSFQRLRRLMGSVLSAVGSIDSISWKRGVISVLDFSTAEEEAARMADSTEESGGFGRVE